MNKEPLTVAALNKYLKYCFDNDENLHNILLKGEISNFKHHSRGHFYFTLKDDEAQISAVMFARDAEHIKLKIEDGMKVIVEGYVTVYQLAGTFQFYVSDIILDGLGELYARFEQLKEKLAKEGLFNKEHKRSLPALPKKIGVITSNTGAAVHDIMTTIERRYPLAEVMIFPTLVQGEEAKYDIVKSIGKANSYPDIDVIILGRGGGSIEDLWPFNEEIVAYAIYRSRIPIISAVGHETDFTIADFVADFRAATPTAAAEISVPNKQDLLFSLKNMKEHLYKMMVGKFTNSQTSYSKLASSYIFMNPRRLYEQNYLKLDKLNAQLEKYNPLQAVQSGYEKTEYIQNRLNFAFERLYRFSDNRFKQTVSKLELVNPLNILKKGYGIVKKDGNTVISVQVINKEDQVTVNLSDGTLSCVVTGKEENSHE